MTARIVKLVVGLLLTASVSIGMIRLGNNVGGLDYETPSETFVGAVSAASYETKEETARAYLSNELKGDSSQPIYLSYEKVDDLTSDEIAGLALDDDLMASVESAEKGIVHYTDNSVEKRSSTTIIKANGKYRYYVSLTAVGEPLTNSYFESVFDGANYLNCTSTTTVNMRVNSSVTSSDVTYLQIIKFDDDVAYFDQQLPGMDFELYFEEVSSSIEVYIEHPQKNDGKLYPLSEINRDLYYQGFEYRVYLTNGNEQIWIDTLDAMQDITDFMFMMDLDASYFVKTSYGFSMPDEKYREVCRMLLDDVDYNMLSLAWDEYHIRFNADYYVTDGRLSASKTVLTLSDGDEVFAITITALYTDFGTTEVTLPNETEG